MTDLLHHLLVASLLIMVFSLLLVLIRALSGGTAHNRILAANVFGSCTVVMIALLSYTVANLQFIDVALVYALINFIGTIAYLKFFRFGRFDVSEAEEISE